MRLRTAATVAATCLGAGAAAVAAGRYVSGLALNPRPNGPALGSPDREDDPLTVHDTAAGAVTLTRTLASLRPGVYGLSADGCHALLGPVLATTPDSVTRRLDRVQEGAPVTGMPVHLTPEAYAGDPQTAHAIAYRDVEVDGELGPMPAWFVPGDRSTCVIAVHGLGTSRRQPLAVLPLLHRLRFPVLVMTYRNDAGAPRSPDGIGHLGDTEWRDVDAALRYAVRYGAERAVLYGWSVGATMALRVADHSPQRSRISGLVLDSPVLDWQSALRGLVRGHGVPAPLVPLAIRAAQGRTGLHAQRLTDSAEPAKLAVPALVFHGPDDTIAPWEHSRRLAELRPDLVTLHTVANAGHQAMWNADPDRYEEALRRFLTPLM
ncbi:alpha/beta hydrolase [Streptomyces sp. RB6PN25]|uniref:Alpha/beta hydrolase n=1 Tax=Streptomyces humicola TaxID=2953240 RepID=A0ABT1Q0E0_9ACTN|nr:alpha/beta hydrolase [Streptomyces humicola]MCQ4083398.1 alpha/beta hydrolase [Streptomyces humicola]